MAGQSTNDKRLQQEFGDFQKPLLTMAEIITIRKVTMNG